MTLEPLSKVAEIVMGQSPPSSTYNQGGKGLPFFQGKADFGDRYPNVRIYCNRPTKIAERGDILISVRAPVGPTNIAPSQCCIGRGLAAIRGKKVDPTFLLHFFRYHEPQLATQGKGSTFEAINRDDLENLPVPIPTPDDQKRIAAILEKADRLRRTRRYGRQLCDTFLQSVFLEMFGDPLSNPNGWQVNRLEELATGENGIVDGPFGSSINVETDYRANGEIPVIRTLNVRPFEFVADNLKFITREKFESVRRSRVVPGDIVLTKVGTIGNVCIFPDEYREALLSTTGSCKITPDNSRVETLFLAHFLSMLRPHMLKIASEGVQAFLNMKTIKDFRVFLPPISIQQKFAGVVRRFERLRAQQREAERQAEHLFQTLLHRAFNGGI